MAKWQASYNFHPVGQGLFTSGAVIAGGSEPFWWVFDCGTYLSAHFKDLSNQIAALLDLVTESRMDCAPKLDVVFISHFDRDHICGLIELLRTFNVGRLVLPYMSLRKRMSIMLDTKSGSLKPWQVFALDPIRYISSTPGINVQRISLVPPSNYPEQDDGASIELPLLDDGLIIEPPPLRPPVTFDEDYLPGSYPIEWLSPSAKFLVKSVWEFIPYNDSSFEKKVSGPFQKIIRKLSNTILDPSYPGSREAVKRSMERIYNKKFGAKDKARNLISLFVYTGAIDCSSDNDHSFFTSNQLTARDFENINRWQYCMCAPFYFWNYVYAVDISTPKSLLLTGDGSLKTKKRLNELVAYLGEQRIENVRVLQVMHHGAITSWHDEVARVINPEYSVFCAFPFGQHPHPHPAVEFALRAHGPIYCRVGYGFSLWQRSDY
jgi:hypothetical protein